jgi:serine protease Do
MSIRGELIKEKESNIIMDLGFDILSIPKEVISRILKNQDTETTKTIQHELYQEKPRATILPFNKLLDILGQSVVTITTPSGLGSGFIIHEDGYVITNDHVIAGETQISITHYPKEGSLRRQFDNIEILSASPEMDLALLKITNKETYKFKSVPLGDTDEIEQGQPVFAIGSPLGLERSVSKGIISLKNRLIEGGLYIQTTTQINPGNSGGPLFNNRGEVIGVNNMKIVAMGAEGLGFAIPSRVLKTFLKNREVFAFDPSNPNSGYRYTKPPK